MSEHFQNGRAVQRLVRSDEQALKKEIGENRGKALAMLKARDAAGTLPEELDEMQRGYMASRILLTAVELGVFTHISKLGTGANAGAIASAMATDLRATEALLNALAALGLVAKSGGTFANSPNAARYLVAGARDDATTAMLHHRSLWQTWSALTEVVRSGHAVARPKLDERGDDWTTPFIAAMHKNAALRAPMVVKAAGEPKPRRMIDIGGGSGAYAIAFAEAYPELEADIFDLPTVVGIARGHVAQAGLENRVRTRTGDLERDAFGTGYDLALLSAICHMLGPDGNRDLLRRVFEAVAPGGRVVIQDHVMNPDKTGPRPGAIFAINMLVGTQAGGTFSEEEYTSWLREAGFGEVRRIALPGPNHLMVATKP